MIQTTWDNICCAANSLSRSLDPDMVCWGLNKSGSPTTKSVYKLLELSCFSPNLSWICKAKIPLKNQIFLWLVYLNAIWLKTIWLKGRWPRSPLSVFCGQIQSIQHLFFSCKIAIPNSLWQYNWWVQAFLPFGDKFHFVALSATCWAISKKKTRLFSLTSRYCLLCRVRFSVLGRSSTRNWSRLPQERCGEPDGCGTGADANDPEAIEDAAVPAGQNQSSAIVCFEPDI